MSERRSLLRVALAVPFADAFDYLAPSGDGLPTPGCRVRVPFGRGERVGIVLEHPERAQVAADKLKRVAAVLDEQPLLDEELLQTLRWAAEYYHHAVGDVLKHALPAPLRRGGPLIPAAEERWAVTEEGASQAPAVLAKRWPRMAQALATLAAANDGLTRARLRELGVGAETLRRLTDRGWAAPRAGEDTCVASALVGDGAPAHPFELTNDQRRVLEEIQSSPPGFRVFLLHGVTGSGKTEVYIRLIERELRAGRQTLLLVPEIGLTPQLVRRLRERFGDRLAVMHSGLSESERLLAWRRARSGEAQLVVGTRSAVFAPLPAAGLVIVDEEHDPSYKQQKGFRYSARDLAVVRARRLGVPIVLASATPALESFHNALTGRYTLLRMPRRIGTARSPVLRIIDLNRHAVQQSLSTPLLAAIEQRLRDGEQVLLFLNRRGFAPALFCTHCRTAEQCRRCDARMTVHAASGRLRCHHCGQERPLQWGCETCNAERIAVGAGTQRVTEQLHSLYPEARIARLDRDAAGRSAALEAMLADVESGETQILVGTQMLTKGHDFPNVTLVGVLDADQGLFGTDFRSDERLAQTILQVAGRAGRGERPGEVIVQTHYPEHPLLSTLRTQDYAAFAELALRERRAAAWPPFSHLALWRAEAPRRSTVLEFLAGVRKAAGHDTGPVEVLGPAAPPIERLGGRYRGHLLFQCRKRAPLHQLLDRTLSAVRQGRRSHAVRWTVDVDPLEL